MNKLGIAAAKWPLAFLLAGAACSVAAQNIVVRIGVVAPMSGALAVSGRANERGARLAVEELNLQDFRIGNSRTRFELVAEDDAGDPKQGTLAAQKLVDSDIKGVVGHQTSGSTIPASRIYNEAGIPQISPSTTSPKYTSQGFKTAFRLMADDAISGRILANFAIKELGMKKFAVIDDRSAYGHGIAEEFSRAVVAAGGSVIGHEYIAANSTDFSAILTTIRGKRPDGVFLGGMYSVAGPMLRQMKQLELGAKLLGGDGICDDEVLRLAGGAAYDGQVICAGPADNLQQARMPAFALAFRKKFGTDPEIVSGYSYDAVHLLADDMRRANSSDPKIYLPVLAATRGYAGLTGPISFDAKGDLLNPRISVYTFKQAHRTHLATAELH